MGQRSPTKPAGRPPGFSHHPNLVGPEALGATTSLLVGNVFLLSDIREIVEPQWQDTSPRRFLWADVTGRSALRVRG